MRALVALVLAGLLGGCSVHVVRADWGTNAHKPDHTADALVVAATWKLAQ